MPGRAGRVLAGAPVTKSRAAIARGRTRQVRLGECDDPGAASQASVCECLTRSAGHQSPAGDQRGAPVPGPNAVRLRGGLRPTAAAGGCATGHPAGAVVAEIGGLRAPAGVRVCHPQCGALALADLGAAVVANENRLACHGIPPENWSWVEPRNSTDRKRRAQKELHGRSCLSGQPLG